MKRILRLANIFPPVGNPAGGTITKSRVQATGLFGLAVDVVGVGVRPRNSNHLPATDFIGDTLECGTVRRLALRLPVRSRHLESSALRTLSDLVDLSSYDAAMAHGMFALGAGRIAIRIGEERGPRKGAIRAVAIAFACATPVSPSGDHARTHSAESASVRRKKGSAL